MTRSTWAFIGLAVAAVMLREVLVCLTHGDYRDFSRGFEPLWVLASGCLVGACVTRWGFRRAGLGLASVAIIAGLMIGINAWMDTREQQERHSAAIEEARKSLAPVRRDIFDEVAGSKPQAGR